MTPAPSDADAEIVERLVDAVITDKRAGRRSTSADALVIQTLKAQRDAALADAAMWRERAGRARTAAIEEAAKACDAFEEENMRMCGDSIILDPVLAKSRRGVGSTVTDADLEVSESRQMDGTINSAMAQAARLIATAIRALPPAAERGETTL